VQPFSFYFDLVEAYWKSGDPHEAPLHRLATLARKQGAETLIIEDGSSDCGAAAEVGHVDEQHGGGGAAQIIRITFLSIDHCGGETGAEPAEALIGSCLLVNYRPPGRSEFELTWIHEAVFATPRTPDGKTLLNNFINVDGLFDVTVKGRVFTVEGVCYAQQNGVTAVCAHASIRMVERTLSPQRPAATTVEVDALLGGPATLDGLLPEELATALEHLTGRQIADIDCDERPPSEYISILTAAADSGEIALLIFRTGGPKGAARTDREPATARVADIRTERDAIVDERRDSGEGERQKDELHVVVVIGYTRNSDEWYPLAVPRYRVPSATSHRMPRYRPASMWVDHFVIHDDNFGPYLTLDARGLESDPAFHAEKILIVRRHPSTVSADMAEAAAAIWLKALPKCVDADPDLRWLELVRRHRGAFVLRPVLLSRAELIEHLEGLVDHEGHRLGARAPLDFMGLPDVVWMVEFSLPDLFTGNRAKLGEVIVDAVVPTDRPLDVKVILGARVPGRVIAAHPGSADSDPRKRYKASTRSVRLASHVPMYMRKQPGQLW